MHEAQSDLVLRRYRRAGWVKVAAGVVGAAAITGKAWNRLGGEAALISAGLWTVLIVWFIGYLYNATISVTSQDIVVKGLVLRRRWPRAQVARVVRATVVGPRGRSDDRLFVLDMHDKVLLRVYGNLFRTEDLDRLVDGLGVPCSGPEHALSAKELERMQPGLVTWIERHTILLGLMITAVLTAVAVGVLAITRMSAG